MKEGRKGSKRTINKDGQSDESLDLHADRAKASITTQTVR